MKETPDVMAMEEKLQQLMVSWFSDLVGEALTSLDEAAALPDGREVSQLYAEADGVFVRGTKKRQGIEVCHAVTHEGWETNGRRVSLQHPRVLMTTQPAAVYWKEVQAVTAHRYSLEHTWVVFQNYREKLDASPSTSPIAFLKAICYL
ncbi:UPF0236 family transposase-like protein [Salibacterium sp. K-3]